MIKKMLLIFSILGLIFCFQNFTSFEDIRVEVIKGSKLLFVSDDERLLIRETKTVDHQSIEWKSTYHVSFNGGSRWLKSKTFKPPTSPSSLHDIAFSQDGEHVAMIESVYNSSNKRVSINVHVSHNSGENWSKAQNFPNYTTSSLNVGGVRDESRQIILSDDGRFLLVNSSYLTSYNSGDVDIINNLFLSVDGGNNWKRIDSGVPKDTLVNEVFFANDNKSIFFSGIVFAGKQQNNYLFSSFNRGKDWQKTYLGVSDIREVLSVWPDSYGYKITKRTKKSVPPKLIISADGKKIYVNFNDEKTGRGSISTNYGKSFKSLLRQPKVAAGSFVGESQLVLLAQNNEEKTIISVSEDNGTLWKKKIFENEQKEFWLAAPKVQARGQALYFSIYAIADLPNPMLYYYLILD